MQSEFPNTVPHLSNLLFAERNAPSNFL